MKDITNRRIDTKMIPTYIPRLKGFPSDIIYSITPGYIGVTMVTLVILSIIVGEYTDSSRLFKKMLRKTRRCV